MAIDGKTLRKSFHKEAGKEALHIVNAFAVTNGITLGSIKVPEKSNEIKGIPKLLQMLKLTGCIVTIYIGSLMWQWARIVVESIRKKLLRISQH